MIKRILCFLFGHSFGKNQLSRICYGVIDISNVCKRCNKRFEATIRRNQLRYGWFLTVDHAQNNLYDELEREYFFLEQTKKNWRVRDE